MTDLVELFGGSREAVQADWPDVDPAEANKWPDDAPKSFDEETETKALDEHWEELEAFQNDILEYYEGVDTAYHERDERWKKELNGA